jgi:hypothetical protein
VVLLREEMEHFTEENQNFFSVKLKNFKTAWAQQIWRLHTEVTEAKAE